MRQRSPPFNADMTHFAETFRYILDGVKNSADIDDNIGTRFGGLGEFTAAASTSRTVSRDGWTPNWVGSWDQLSVSPRGLGGLGPAYL